MKSNNQKSLRRMLRLHGFLSEESVVEKLTKAQFVKECAMNKKYSQKIASKKVSSVEGVCSY